MADRQVKVMLAEHRAAHEVHCLEQQLNPNEVMLLNTVDAAWRLHGCRDVVVYECETFWQLPGHVIQTVLRELRYAGAGESIRVC